MKVKVEFSGGLELLFNNAKKIDIEVVEEAFTVGNLIEHLRKNHLKEKEEMFVQGGSVRPGIIVMINDTDWELEGTTSYSI
jgi:ubiquitin related modifier 1